MSIKQQVVPKGSPVTLEPNTFTRTGFTFNNWKDETGKEYGYDQSYTFDSDITLYAQWKAVAQHSVRFLTHSGDGADVLTSFTVPDGTTIPQNSYSSLTPSLSTWVFDGWVDRNGSVSVTGPITGDVDFVGSWYKYLTIDDSCILHYTYSSQFTGNSRYRNQDTAQLKSNYQSNNGVNWSYANVGIPNGVAIKAEISTIYSSHVNASENNHFVEYGVFVTNNSSPLNLTSDDVFLASIYENPSKVVPLGNYLPVCLDGVTTTGDTLKWHIFDQSSYPQPGTVYRVPSGFNATHLGQWALRPTVQRSKELLQKYGNRVIGQRREPAAEPDYCPAQTGIWCRRLKVYLY